MLDVEADPTVSLHRDVSPKHKADVWAVYEMFPHPERLGRMMVTIWSLSYREMTWCSVELFRARVKPVETALGNALSRFPAPCPYVSSEHTAPLKPVPYAKERSSSESEGSAVACEYRTAVASA